MEPDSERRKTSRESFIEKIQVYPLFPSYSEWFDRTKQGFLEAFTLDLSFEGVGLRTSVPLKAGSIVKLQMELVGRKNFEVLGRIAWSNDLLCGVSFTTFTIN